MFNPHMFTHISPFLFTPHGNGLRILHGMVSQGRRRLTEGHEVRVLGGLPDHHHAGKGHLAWLALEFWITFGRRKC